MAAAVDGLTEALAVSMATTMAELARARLALYHYPGYRMLWGFLRLSSSQDV